MSFAVVVLIIRIALVAALYLFLFLVVRAMARDLRSATRMSHTRRARSSAPATAQLVVLAIGQTSYTVGQRFTLTGATSLGRDPQCDIPVEDDFVSAQHLKLAHTNGLWLAHDLNSTNGTKINGTRLRGTVPLKNGDMLELGRLKLRLVLDS